MQVLIDMPQEDYNFIKTQVTEMGITDPLKICIANGTPLPRNHGDLIDVNRKITVSVYDDEFEYWFEETMTVLDALNKWSDEGVTVKDIVIPSNTEV